MKIQKILGGGEYRLTSGELRDLDVLCVLGGVKLYLDDADSAGEDIEINVSVFAGGLDIYLSNAWEIDVNVTHFLSGINYDKRNVRFKSPDTLKEKRLLTVEGVSYLGGINIKTLET